MINETVKVEYFEGEIIPSCCGLGRLKTIEFSEKKDYVIAIYYVEAERA